MEFTEALLKLLRENCVDEFSCPEFSVKLGRDSRIVAESTQLEKPEAKSDPNQDLFYSTPFGG